LKDRRTPIVILSAILASGVAGALLLGPDPRRPAAQVVGAAQDALVPVAVMHDERTRHDAIRSELSRLASLQLAAIEDEGEPIGFEDLPGIPERFRLQVIDGAPLTAGIVRTDRSPPRWIGVLTHDESPPGEACAVSINTEPAYASGIVLRRSGRIRCSWDLATRLNRLFAR